MSDELTRTPPASPAPVLVRRAAREPRPAIHDVLELLGRRWALRIVWELRAGETGFRALRAACGDVSTSVLSQRLRELRAAGVIDLQAHHYGLTALGAELADDLAPLEAWAQRWTARGG